MGGGENDDDDNDSMVTTSTRRDQEEIDQDRHYSKSSYRVPSTTRQQDSDDDEDENTMQGRQYVQGREIIKSSNVAPSEPGNTSTLGFIEQQVNHAMLISETQTSTVRELPIDQTTSAFVEENNYPEAKIVDKSMDVPVIVSVQLEVSDWLEKHSFPQLKEGFERLKIFTLSSLLATPEEEIKSLTSELKPIPKRKFVALVNELRTSFVGAAASAPTSTDATPQSQPIPAEHQVQYSPLEKRSSEDEATKYYSLEQSNAIAAASSSVAASSAVASAHIYRRTSREEEEEEPEPEFGPIILQSAEDSLSLDEVVKLIEVENHVIEHLINLAFSQKDQYTKTALEILNASKAEHQERAKRLKRVAAAKRKSANPQHREDEKVCSIQQAVPIGPDDPDRHLTLGDVLFRFSVPSYLHHTSSRKKYDTEDVKFVSAKDAFVPKSEDELERERQEERIRLEKLKEQEEAVDRRWNCGVCGKSNSQSDSRCKDCFTYRSGYMPNSEPPRSGWGVSRYGFTTTNWNYDHESKVTNNRQRNAATGYNEYANVRHGSGYDGREDPEGSKYTYYGTDRNSPAARAGEAARHRAEEAPPRSNPNNHFDRKYAPTASPVSMHDTEPLHGLHAEHRGRDPTIGGQQSRICSTCKRCEVIDRVEIRCPRCITEDHARRLQNRDESLGLSPMATPMTDADLVAISNAGTSKQSSPSPGDGTVAGNMMDPAAHNGAVVGIPADVLAAEAMANARIPSSSKDLKPKMRVFNCLNPDCGEVLQVYKEAKLCPSCTGTNLVEVPQEVVPDSELSAPPSKVDNTPTVPKSTPGVSNSNSADYVLNEKAGKGTEETSNDATPTSPTKPVNSNLPPPRGYIEKSVDIYKCQFCFAVKSQNEYEANKVCDNCNGIGFSRQTEKVFNKAQELPSNPLIAPGHTIKKLVVEKCKTCLATREKIDGAGSRPCSACGGKSFSLHAQSAVIKEGDPAGVVSSDTDTAVDAARRYEKQAAQTVRPAAAVERESQPASPSKKPSSISPPHTSAAAAAPVTKTRYRCKTCDAKYSEKLTNCAVCGGTNLTEEKYVDRGGAVDDPLRAAPPVKNDYPDNSNKSPAVYKDYKAAALKNGPVSAPAPVKGPIIISPTAGFKCKGCLTYSSEKSNFCSICGGDKFYSDNTSGRQDYPFYRCVDCFRVFDEKYQACTTCGCLKFEGIDPNAKDCKYKVVYECGDCGWEHDYRPHYCGECYRYSNIQRKVVEKPKGWFPRLFG